MAVCLWPCSSWPSYPFAVYPVQATVEGILRYPSVIGEATHTHGAHVRRSPRLQHASRNDESPKTPTTESHRVRKPDSLQTPDHASEVVFLLDKTKYGTSSILEPEMAEWQGPTLSMRLLLPFERGIGLNESEMIQLFQNCSNLTSLRLMSLHCGHDFDFRIPLTDDTLKALSLYCPKLQVVEFTFTFCSVMYPSEIGLTQEGIVTLIQSCPIRVVILNGATIFYDEGMKDLSSAQFLERLELVDCKNITDAGIRFTTCAPSLISLTLQRRERVTDRGITGLVSSQKLESLTVVGCRRIPLKGVHGAASSVHYSREPESQASPKGMKRMELSTMYRQIFL